MDYGMYAIGAIIFGVYMYLTIWNIIYSSEKQEEENKATIEDDSVDYDGMGNFSRFPKSTEKKRKEIILK